MKQKGMITIFCLSLLLLMPTILAEQTIDITGLSTEEYNPGEELRFSVVVLEGTQRTETEVQLTLNDALEKKTIQKTITSNTETTIPITADFPSGLWEITATTKETTVERTFLIGEQTGVLFIIDGDELVIQNNGNTRYTRTIQITIGEHTESYLQNIGVGEEKRLKLVSPRGEYDIVVTDGKTTLRRQNIELFGTGNVIGAVDKSIVGYTGFAGANEIVDSADREVSLAKLPVSLTFILAVFVLGILVFFERKMTRAKKKR